MTDYDAILDMTMTALERRGKRLVDDPNPADIVLERTAFQHAIQAGFRSRQCVRCDNQFPSVGAEDTVCDWCQKRRTKL